MNIKNRRLSLNISQKDLANNLKISQSALCMIENGRRRCSIELLPKLARALNCTVDELLQKDLKAEKENSLPGEKG